MMALELGGCAFAPEPCRDCDPPGPVLLPRRTSPQNAVLYFKAAWEVRDSSAVDTLLAGGYTGTSVDVNDPGSGTLSFSRDDEIRAVGGLYLDQEVSFVQLDFKAPSTWVPIEYSSDPPDYVTISVPYPSISVTKGPTTYILGEVQAFEFTMAPEPGTPGIWQVVRWKEIGASEATPQ